jgi:hypothetical protein
MTFRRLLVASVLVCCTSLAGSARAQAPTESELEEARHAFEVASQSFERGDYETAAEEFRAAYALSRHPDILYNVYLAEERAGRQAEAAAALAAHLEVAEISDEQRTLLSQRLERIRARVAAHEASVATSEGEALRTEPIDAALAEPESEEPAPAVETPVAPPSSEPPAAGIALLIAGGVLGLSFAGFAIASELEDQRLAGSCGRDVGSHCLAEETSTLEILNVLADASWISAATVGALGAILLAALPWSDDAPRATVFFDGRSGGATLRGVF